MGLIRTLLAIGVVFAHSSWNGGYVFVGGQNAVQLFYLISGFLMAHVINSSRSYTTVSSFYVSRILRIAPIYYVVALLVLMAPLLANPKLFALYRDIPDQARIILIASNLLIFGQDWVMFTSVKGGQLVWSSNFLETDALLYQGLLIPQAWTLGLELSFYVMAPWVLPRERLVLTLMTLSLFVRALLELIGLSTQDPWSYRFFPAEMFFFLLGALCHRYWQPWVNTRLLAGPAGNPVCALVTWFVVAVCTFYFLLPLPERGKAIALFCIFIVSLPLLFNHQGKSDLDRKIGDLSYPIYISHMLVVSVVRHAWRKFEIDIGDVGQAIVNVACSILLAWLLNRWIAQPVEAIRSRFKRS